MKVKCIFYPGATAFGRRLFREISFLRRFAKMIHIRFPKMTHGVDWLIAPLIFGRPL